LGHGNEEIHGSLEGCKANYELSQEVEKRIIEDGTTA